jgi:hypothetical protein
MATSNKRLNGLSMVGFVFMLTGGTWIAVGQPILAAGMFVVGGTLFCAGVAAARKAAPLDDSIGITPPADAGSRQRGDADDRRGV